MNTFLVLVKMSWTRKEKHYSHLLRFIIACHTKLCKLCKSDSKTLKMLPLVQMIFLLQKNVHTVDQNTEIYFHCVISSFNLFFSYI